MVSNVENGWKWQDHVVTAVTQARDDGVIDKGGGHGWTDARHVVEATCQWVLNGLMIGKENSG